MPAITNRLHIYGTQDQLNNKASLQGELSVKWRCSGLEESVPLTRHT